MVARSAPVTTVESADQRNQKSAAGAIPLLPAGFCSSGILGIDGVCTKLKYQSRPIHITPAVMCSQRMANSHQACCARLTALPVSPAAMNSRMTSTTTPAMMVRLRDWKIAPMVFSFVMGWSEKSLAPSPGPGQQAARCSDQHRELQQREQGLQPVALGDQRRQQPRVAHRGDEAEQGDRGKVEAVAVRQLAEPRPAL